MQVASNKSQFWHRKLFANMIQKEFSFLLLSSNSLAESIKKLLILYLGCCSSTTDPWNFLSIQMNHTSEDHWADPDLYGLFDEVGNKVSKRLPPSHVHVSSSCLYLVPQSIPKIILCQLHLLSKLRINPES